MRVVILLDRPFARRERRMLSRLEIGLADEGVRVIHAVPREILSSEPVGLYTRTVGYDPPGFPVSLRARATRLAEALRDAADDGPDRGIDVVHAWSPEVWRLGAEVALRLQAGALFEVWSSAAVGWVGDRLGHEARPAVGVGDPVLAKALRSRYPRAVVHENLWGVHGEELRRPEPTADRAVALLMLVDGSGPAYLDSAMKGLAAACKRDPRLLIFVNTERARGHVVWKMARRLGLSDRLSLIPDAEARREAIMNLDGLVIAEPSGTLRSIALDAMACGMPVIAAADPALGSYVAGVTARLVSRPDPPAWEEAIAGLVSGAQEFVHLRASAAGWVAASRPASGHIAAVLRCYDAVMRHRHLPAGAG